MGDGIRHEGGLALKYLLLLVGTLSDLTLLILPVFLDADGEISKVTAHSVGLLTSLLDTADTRRRDLACLIRLQ